MNQTQSYMDMHPGAHMSTGPSYSHTATASAMPHYPHYPQAAVMPPSSAHYPPGPSYGYGYGNPVTSPQSAGPLPSMMASTGAQPYGHAAGGPAPGYANAQPYDNTGQIPPTGMKPRVTATLWEDEGSLCFQVEAKGVCVARREDNHFINGTKLLNVAGMTRGRRDGILKSEKTRHVVKIGPMHLKGVWIPFERALEFANKEKITAELYPLFVHNISSLLYNPENASRSGNVVQTADRRRIEGPDVPRSAQSSQPPSLQHHHHSLQNGNSSQVPPTPHSIGGAGRPSLDRAHTFPTPPTSASSVMGIGSSGNSYDWNASAMNNGVNTNTQPLSIDTGLNNTRSMPTTPATTPPGNNAANMNGYQNHQSYDSKHYYAHTPSSQTGYSQQSSGRYDSYGKTDMGPPTAPPSGSSDAHESNKTESYGAPHAAGETGEHPDGSYMSSASAAYNRSYAYNHAPEHQHLSPEMTNSPSHQTVSGRGTPRTMPGAQSWSQDYQTPPRGPPSNLYSTVGDARNSNANDAYATSNYTATGKRGRDDDDDKADAYKRQKMARSDTFGMPLTPNVHMQPIKTGGGLPGQR